MTEIIDASHPIELTFWGVRGSKPTPGKHTVKFGGNTSCVQVQIANRMIVFDGGTGLAELGHHLVSAKKTNEQSSISGDIFFSHLHWDHIQGIPFFQPFFQEGNRFTLYGEQKLAIPFQKILYAQMNPPQFPIKMDSMKARLLFNEMTSKQTIDLGEGIIVTTFAVNHPNGCLAFCLTYNGHSVVYCTDTEPMLDHMRDDFITFIHAADVLIIDSHFEPEEYLGMTDGMSKIGWGHASWEDSVKLGHDAKVDTLVLFHHKDNRTDEEQLLIEKKAAALFPRSVAAREGMKLLIGGNSPEKIKIHYP